MRALGTCYLEDWDGYEESPKRCPKKACASKTSLG
jgi:hypothetical protein